MNHRPLIVSTSVFVLAMAAANACASFDESPEPPSGADAATDGSTTDDAGNDAAGDGAASRCVPEPSDAVDAGEDARCDPDSSLEVNIAFSNAHCGFCSHACAANNACTNGACTTETIPTDDEAVAVGNARTPTHLYFVANAAGCGLGRLRRAEVGKSTSEIVLTETANGCLTNLFLANDYLYYLHPGYGLRRTPLQTPSPGQPPIVAEGEGVSGFLATNTALLLLDNTYARVIRRNLDGQAPQTIHEDLTSQLHTFGTDGTSAWWTTEPLVDGGIDGATLWGLLPGNDTAVKRATGFPNIRTFALDSEYFYFTTGQGDIRRLRQNDDSPAEHIASIDYTSRSTLGLTVIGDWLYIAVGTVGANGAVEFYRTKKCGGQARLVARDALMQTPEIIAAGGAIYFSGGSVLKRFAPAPP